MKRLLIFASGSGTNADNICQYFAKNDEVKVVGLFCNNPQAGVISKMAKMECTGGVNHPQTT